LISSISANSCKECGQLFVVAARRKVYCSSKCGDKEQNRVQKHRRAARKKGVRHENVSASKVFEAAGWKCSACRKETPKSERGKHNHNSPELDHIMPLSKGGSHTYDNTQCLCRQCNALKSDNIWHVAKG
jgi:5-methylcytosine-specific restriction endonuclease McrA